VAQATPGSTGQLKGAWPAAGSFSGSFQINGGTTVLPNVATENGADPLFGFSVLNLFMPAIVTGNNSDLALVPPTSVDFGKVLPGSLWGGNFQIANAGSDGTSAQFTAQGNGVSVVGASTVPVTGNGTASGGFELLAPPTAGAGTGAIKVKNAAADSAGPGLGSADVDSFFDIFYEVVIPDPNGVNLQNINIPAGGSYAGLMVKGAQIVGTAGNQKRTVSMVSRPSVGAGDGHGFAAGVGGPNPQIISDVVDITGTAPDPILVIMTYNDAGIPEEAASAAQGHIQIVSLNDDGLWVPTIMLNSDGGAGAAGQASHLMGPGGVVPSLATLSHWGVDTEANVVWAVVDHNSFFAVVPEPASLVLLAASALGLMARRRRQA
jgi:hypothetical protein